MSSRGVGTAGPPYKCIEGLKPNSPNAVNGVRITTSPTMNQKRRSIAPIFVRIACAMHALISLAHADTPADVSSVSPLTRWPAPSVERPLTLSESLAQWKAWSFVSSAQPWGWFPLGFEYGVTDTLTLVWLPIPIEIRWRAYSDALREKQLTLSFNILGAVTSQTQNFNWSPFARADFRWRPLGWFALDTALGFVGELRREVVPFAATLVAEISPRFQVFSWFWVAPWVGLWSEWGAPRSLYWGASPTIVAGDLGLRVPVGAALGFTLSNRVELESRVTQMGIGANSGFAQTQWQTSLSVWF